MVETRSACVAPGFGSIGFRGFTGGCGPVVELHADLFHRTKRQIAEQQSRKKSGPYCEARESESLAKPGGIGLAQQGCARSDMHCGERFAVSIQGHDHIEDSGRAENLPIELNRIGVEQLLVVGTSREQLVVVVGIGAEDDARLRVGNVDVIDAERVEVDRIDHRMQCVAVVNRLRLEIAQLGGVIRIDGLARHALFQRLLQGKAQLVGDHLVVRVGLLDGCIEQLRDIDQRNQARDENHQAGNGDHEFGLQTHGYATDSMQRQSYTG